jgi:hypothetical protein
MLFFEKGHALRGLFWFIEVSGLIRAAAGF